MSSIYFQIGLFGYLIIGAILTIYLFYKSKKNYDKLDNRLKLSVDILTSKAQHPSPIVRVFFILISFFLVPAMFVTTIYAIVARDQKIICTRCANKDSKKCKDCAIKNPDSSKKYWAAKGRFD